MRAAGAGLPSLLWSLGGGRVPPEADRPGTGALVHHVDVARLINLASRAGLHLVVDLDSVDGLRADEEAAFFLVRRLGVRAVVTKHGGVAAALAERGVPALLHVHALDSTGLERTLAGHPRTPGMGTAVSPGVVLPYLGRADREGLPRPLLACGLVRTEAEVAACRRAGADSVARLPAAGFPNEDLDMAARRSSNRSRS
ncbi:MAG: glycerol-3-phosphate responsive antiterminator [Candidatus Dormibacterales bacterium]